MNELIGTIVTDTGLPAERVEQALGIMLNLIKTQGNQAKVQELFDKLPGAQMLIDKHADRMTGLLAGGMMGGPLAALTKLQAIGLNGEQMKHVAAAMLTYARARAGDDMVRQAAANIPGLSGFL